MGVLLCCPECTPGFCYLNHNTERPFLTKWQSFVEQNEWRGVNKCYEL